MNQKKTQEAFAYVQKTFPNATNKNELIQAFTSGYESASLDPNSCENQLKLLKASTEKLKKKWLTLHNQGGKKPLPVKFGYASDHFCDVAVEHYAEHFAEEDDIKIKYHITVGYEDFAPDEEPHEQIRRLRKAARWMIQLAGWMEKRLAKRRR